MCSQFDRWKWCFINLIIIFFWNCFRHSDLGEVAPEIKASDRRTAVAIAGKVGLVSTRKQICFFWPIGILDSSTTLGCGSRTSKIISIRFLFSLLQEDPFKGLLSFPHIFKIGFTLKKVFTTQFYWEHITPISARCCSCHSELCWGQLSSF